MGGKGGVGMGGKGGVVSMARAAAGAQAAGAKQSKAKQSKAKQSKAKQSKAKQSKAKQSKAKQSSLTSSQCRSGKSATSRSHAALISVVAGHVAKCSSGSSVYCERGLPIVAQDTHSAERWRSVSVLSAYSDLNMTGSCSAANVSL